MKKYGSFCPIAKAAEILTERWTLLVLRDMLQGSHTVHGSAARHPTDVTDAVVQAAPNARGDWPRRAAPRMWEVRTGTTTRLRPRSEFGRLSWPIGHWGQRWVRSQLTPDELDPGRLMWFMHRHFAVDRLPCELSYSTLRSATSRSSSAGGSWPTAESVELCWDDPGYDVDISIFSDVLTLTQVFIGDLSLNRARSMDRLEVQGPKSWYAPCLTGSRAASSPTPTRCRSRRPPDVRAR